MLNTWRTKFVLLKDFLLHWWLTIKHYKPTIHQNLPHAYCAMFFLRRSEPSWNPAISPKWVILVSWGLSSNDKFFWDQDWLGGLLDPIYYWIYWIFLGATEQLLDDWMFRKQQLDPHWAAQIQTLTCTWDVHQWVDECYMDEGQIWVFQFAQHATTIPEHPKLKGFRVLHVRSCKHLPWVDY